MPVDFIPYFRRYESIVNAADEAFRKISVQFPDCVRCRIGCADCCHALFDIPLIEALYIHYHFDQKLDAERRAAVLEKANTADRRIYKIKRRAYRSAASGGKETEILNAMSTERVRCPLLNEADRCELYDQRPITCRLYGIPTATDGRGHTCGLSGFQRGTVYPTAHIDRFYRRLYEITAALVRDIRSRHAKMADMLVPVSMALLTDYNESFLGIDPGDPIDQGG